MNSDGKKLITAKAEDLFTLCGKYSSPTFSDFLDGAEIAVINRETVFPYGYNTMEWGGFDGAEKKILGVFPEWEEPDRAAFPIVCVRVDTGGEPTHRDFLGSVMALGISPSKLGDIVVFEGGAYIFLHEDIAEYLISSLHKIGNRGAKISPVSDGESLKIERRYKTVTAVCASERLDAVTAAAANISRSEASGLISGGKVKQNHLEVTKPSVTVSEGDLLSIRGSGRFIVAEFGAKTRKDRLHVTFKKYI